MRERSDAERPGGADGIVEEQGERDAVDPALVLLRVASPALDTFGLGGILGPVRGDWWRYLVAPFIYPDIGYLFVASVGIAIFDNPGNPRYPTYWHARGGGLFATNIFGVHDFENDKSRQCLPCGYFVNYPARIRTWTKRAKISCATVTLPGRECPSFVAGQLHQEGELLHLHRQVHRDQADRRRQAEHHRGEVQDAANSGGHQGVRDRLGRLGGHRQ